MDKLAEYFAAGTRLVWVAYPSQFCVYAYTGTTDIRVIDLEGTLDGGGVLPQFTFPLRELFKGIDT